MAKKVRRDCAQLNLRMERAERDRIRAGIPRGSLNAVAIQLLLDYAQAAQVTSNSLPSLSIARRDASCLAAIAATASRPRLLPGAVVKQLLADLT